MANASDKCSSPTRPAENGDLLTLPEAAEFMRVRPGTVYAWVAARRIPCLRAGSRLRFRRDDLLEWLRGSGRRK